MLSVSKRDFVQHTSRYLNLTQKDEYLVITHHGVPCLKLLPFKEKTTDDLKGLVVDIKGDMTKPVLEGFEQWL